MSRLLLAELARRPPLLPGRDVVAFTDIDSMQQRACGRQKQGAAFGHTKIQGESLLDAGGTGGLGVLLRGVHRPRSTTATTPRLSRYSPT